MRAKWLKVLALTLAFGMIAAACGGDSDDDGGSAETSTAETTATTAEAPPTTVETEVITTEAPVTVNYGGELIMGLEAEATGLRPWEDSCASSCYNIMITVYDKLFEESSEFQPTPWLAASSEANADFSEFKVTLREGVTFHNGVELTAQTIADMFPIQQAGSQASGAIAASGLASVEATGPMEVTYTLSRGNSAFLSFLTLAPLGMVFEPAAAAADLDAFTLAPVGTGPFVIAERDVDNQTTVVRNENYWMTDSAGNQLPYLDSIEFRPIGDEGTRLSSLVSGTTNVMETRRQGTVRDARDAGGLVMYEFQGNNMGGGMFNVAVAPFDDLRVRQGLTHLNNQTAVIDALGGTGISLPGSQWFSPDSPWWSQAAADAYPAFDIEGGTALLQAYVDDPARSDGKAAGEPIFVELSCPPDPTLIAAMQVLQTVWESTGLVTTELTSYDQPTHINNALGTADDGFIGTHQAHCWRWSSDQDPSLSLNSAFGAPTFAIAEETGAPFSATNFPNFFDLDLYNNLVAAVQTDDFQTRYDLYEQVNLVINEQNPIWYSGHTATLIATAEGIIGFNGWTTQDGVLGSGFPGAEARFTYVSFEE